MKKVLTILIFLMCAGFVFAASGPMTKFSDSLIRIQDNNDATKRLAFEVSAITTATTRTWTIPDNNFDFANLMPTGSPTFNQVTIEEATDDADAYFNLTADRGDDVTDVGKFRKTGDNATIHQLWYEAKTDATEGFFDLVQLQASETGAFFIVCGDNGDNDRNAFFYLIGGNGKDARLIMRCDDKDNSIDDWEIMIDDTDSNMNFKNDGNVRMEINNNGAVLLPAVYSDTISASPRDLEISVTGQLGYVSSTRNHKENIKSLTKADWIYDLSPKIYDRKDGSSVNEIGLIAEDINDLNIDPNTLKTFIYYDHIAADPCDPNSKPSRKIVGYNQKALIVPLLKEVQRLKVIIDDHEKRIKALEPKE